MLGPWPLPHNPLVCQIYSVLNHPPPQQDQPVWRVGTGKLLEILLSPGGKAVLTGLWSGLKRTQGGGGNWLLSVLHVSGS